MPAVTEKSKPNGEPIASTHSPTESASESPIVTVGSPSPSILSTAMSELGSVPTTSATNWRRSCRRTSTSSASATTWLLVST